MLYDLGEAASPPDDEQPETDEFDESSFPIIKEEPPSE